MRTTTFAPVAMDEPDNWEVNKLIKANVQYAKIVRLLAANRVAFGGTVHGLVTGDFSRIAPPQRIPAPAF